MQKTWMPTTAGILDIISGSFGALCGAVLLVLGTAGGSFLAFYKDVGVPQLAPAAILALFLTLAIPLVIIGILAIVGGIYALRRKNWGLALAGSIAAFFPSWLLGIAAIVLIALSRDEFE